METWIPAHSHVQGNELADIHVLVLISIKKMLQVIVLTNFQRKGFLLQTRDE